MQSFQFIGLLSLKKIFKIFWPSRSCDRDHLYKTFILPLQESYIWNLVLIGKAVAKNVKKRRSFTHNIKDDQLDYLPDAEDS